VWMAIVRYLPRVQRLFWEHSRQRFGVVGKSEERQKPVWRKCADESVKQAAFFSMVAGTAINQ